MMPLFLPTASLIVDLVLSVSSMEKVRPQEYTIEGLNHNDGSVIKISVASNIVALQPKSAQSYLRSFRLVWHLPHGQLHVMRVTTDTTVSEALHRLLRERDLTHHTFIVYDTREPARSLNVREALGQYSIKDLTLEWADEAVLGSRMVSSVSSNLDTQSQPSQLVLYLLWWQLPDDQSHSTPISADTTVSEALHRLFRYVDLDYGRYMVYNTREPNQPLHESLPLGQYGIRELTLVKRTSEAASPSYPVLTLSSVSSRKSSQRSVDSVDSRRLSPVQAMSASSADLTSVGRPSGQPSRPPRKRAKAPPPPAPPSFTAPKKRPAPQPPTSENSVIRRDSDVKSNSSSYMITQPTHDTCESLPIINTDHNSLKEVKSTSASPSKLEILDNMKFEDERQPSHAPASLDLAHEPKTKYPTKNIVDVSHEEKVLQQNTNATNDIVPSSVVALDPESLNVTNIDKSEDHLSSLTDETQCIKNSKEAVKEETGLQVMKKIEKSEESHQSIFLNVDLPGNNLHVLNKEVPNTNDLYSETNDNLKQLSSNIVGEGHVSPDIGNIVSDNTYKNNYTMEIDCNLTEDSATIAKSSPSLVASSEIDSHRGKKVQSIGSSSSEHSPFDLHLSVSSSCKKCSACVNSMEDMPGYSFFTNKMTENDSKHVKSYSPVYKNISILVESKFRQKCDRSKQSDQSENEDEILQKITTCDFELQNLTLDTNEKRFDADPNLSVTERSSSSDSISSLIEKINKYSAEVFTTSRMRDSVLNSTLADTNSEKKIDKDEFDKQIGYTTAASLMCHHVETSLPDKISTKDIYTNDIMSHNSVDETTFSSYRPSPTELLKQIELIKKDSKPKLVGAVRKVDLAHKEIKPIEMDILENNNSDKTKNPETKHNQVGSVTEALRRLHTQDMYIIPTNYSNTFERSYRAQPKITKTEAIHNNNMKIKEDVLQSANYNKLSSISLDRKHEIKKVTSGSRHNRLLNNHSMSQPDGIVDEHRKANGVSVNGTNKNNIADKLIETKTKIITPPRFVLNSWKDLPRGPSVLKIADDSTHGSSADVDFQFQCLKFEDMHSPVPSPPLQGLTSIVATQTSDGLHAPSANV